MAGELAGLGDVGDRQDAGHDLGVDPGRGGLVAEAEEAVGREEELGDRAVGAGVDLALEIVEIGGRVGRIGMAFGIGGDRNLERRDLLQARDQLGGIGIAVRMRRERLRPARADRRAGRRCGGRRPPNRRARSSSISSRLALDAGEVRGGGERGLAGDPRDGGVGALAGRAAGAIGDRDEARGRAAPAS